MIHVHTIQQVEESSSSVVKDAYFVSGGQPSLKNTWQRLGAFKGAPPVVMKARFDRQLFGGVGLELGGKEGGFELIGTKKIPTLSSQLEIQRGYSTCSDHFGILCTYHLNT